YVCQPSGFEDLDYPDKVYKVVKSLYGLYQAPRAWYKSLVNYLLGNGFQRGKIDQTLFIKKHKGDILLVQVYVDDIIFESTNKELCKAFERLVKDKFQMSSMGELAFFLGLQVKQKDDGIFISQDKYIAKILKKFGFTNIKSASTPFEAKSLYSRILMATATIKKVNDVVQLRALIDGKKVKENQEKDKIGSKPDKNGKRGEVGKSLKQLQWMDVKSAFLYGTIEEEVYVCQPSEFEDLDYPDKVYKVVKSLYGLYQAPRAWYKSLVNYLLGNGFQRGKIDQTLFIKKHKGDILLVQVYVDDIIFESTNKELCKAFERLVKDKFQMSSMGELAFFLGLQVKQKDDGIFISQDKYIAKILKKFGFINIKSASTPFEAKSLYSRILM
nr:copia protein [Tanacetum cinerariifolium]